MERITEEKERQLISLTEERDREKGHLVEVKRRGRSLQSCDSDTPV